MIVKHLIEGAALSGRISRCWTAAERVHNITGENKVLLFIEVVYNWFRFGCSDEDFLTMEFYRKNTREKKRWLTSAKNNRYLYKTVYDDYARKVFDHKEYFDNEFKTLMNHDFLILKEASKDDILSFLKKYKEPKFRSSGF